MKVSFYNNFSEKNVLNKNISKINDVEIVMRDTFNIHNPILFMSNSLIESIGNYIFIENVNRYYFVDKIDFVKTDLIQLSLSCDYLMTFRDVIKKSCGVVVQTKTLQNYSSIYNVLDKTTQKVINFSDTENKFSENQLYLIGAN